MAAVAILTLERDAKKQSPVFCKITRPNKERAQIADSEFLRFALDQIAARFLKERGVKADKLMLSRFFAAEEISVKKTVRASKQDRADVGAALVPAALQPRSQSDRDGVRQS